MSIIKNKQKLVERAKGHAKLDHVTQGTYGRAKTNGDVEFKGCFIGCYATPHTQDELREWIERHGFRGNPPSPFSEFAGMLYVDASEAELVEELDRQFGICEGIARSAETVFENINKDSDAIDFLPRVAEALPEGVDVTDEMVEEWAEIGMSHDTFEEDGEALIAWLRSLDPAATKAAA